MVFQEVQEHMRAALKVYGAPVSVPELPSSQPDASESAGGGCRPSGIIAGDDVRFEASILFQRIP